MLRSLLLIPVVLAFNAADAHADDLVRCASGATSLAYAANDGIELSGDTGWFPSGYVAQLRITAQVAGHTNVNAGYQATACWDDDDMKAGLAGTPGSGYLDVAYGAELALFGRIHTNVLGYQIDWEGQIPIPWIPEDLLLAGAGGFDPRVDTFGVYVQDTTDPVTVLKTDLISQLISVGGIAGGLYVTVQGGMTTTYRAKKVTLADGHIDAESDRVRINQPEGGYQSNVSLPVGVEGTLHYAPQLTFAAGFDVRILGIRVAQWEFVSIPMSLPAIDRSIKLDGDDAIVQLPELDGLGEGARMDFESASSQVLHVKNTGEAALQLIPQFVPDGIKVQGLTLEAGAEADLRVTVSEGALEAGATTLQFITNDPDRPHVEIALGMSVGGTDAGVAPEINPETGGCSTGGGQGAGALAFVLLALTTRRRGAGRARCR